MATEAQRNAKKRYEKRCKRLVVTLYPTDEDIKQHIAKKEGYNAYIKQLIRDDMNRERC